MKSSAFNISIYFWFLIFFCANDVCIKMLNSQKKTILIGPNKEKRHIIKRLNLQSLFKLARSTQFRCKLLVDHNKMIIRVCANGLCIKKLIGPNNEKQHNKHLNLGQHIGFFVLFILKRMVKVHILKEIKRNTWNTNTLFENEKGLKKMISCRNCWNQI